MTTAMCADRRMMLISEMHISEEKLQGFPASSGSNEQEEETCEKEKETMVTCNKQDQRQVLPWLSLKPFYSTRKYLVNAPHPHPLVFI